MHLDDVIADHKRAAIVWAAALGGVLLGSFVPGLNAWRMTTLSVAVSVPQWLFASRRYRRWEALFAAVFVGCSILLDYFSRWTSLRVSLYIFLAWFLVTAPFSFWLGRKEQRGTAAS